MTILRPFFSYFGGKWRAARHYPKPLHGHIIEPFAGSAGYALRYPSLRVTLVDLSPVVCGVWRYLISTSASEILALPDLQAGQSVDDLTVCQEARWLIGLWLNKGTAAPCKTMSKWGRAGTHVSSFWGASIRRRIAYQLPFVRHWRVKCATYDSTDNCSATWFVDPPYERAGLRYPYGSGRIDFQRLGTWCMSRRGQVIVCEAEGAKWLPFSPLMDAKGTEGGGRSGVSREVIWSSGCALQGDLWGQP